MALTPGTRVGPYEIVSPLGRGGMGEVYRARDRRLGRDVAVKVLPAHFLNDPDRLARFEREARVLAALNHPHIAAIYEIEDAGGMPALVLEDPSRRACSICSICGSRPQQRRSRWVRGRRRESSSRTAAARGRCRCRTHLVVSAEARSN